MGRYSVNKWRAHLVKLNKIPKDLDPTTMWKLMEATQLKFRGKLNAHRPLFPPCDIALALAIISGALFGYCFIFFNRLSQYLRTAVTARTQRFMKATSSKIASFSSLDFPRSAFLMPTKCCLISWRLI